ncbi:hypothetical protein HGRIS_008241 [Hohenbuehelia grisea]|uniref:Methyltransferase domain-containing protein n=1 Tax=Hohenbuehelia grisea TaxID=104357 RepID=A0ABR3J7E0_9AGAR
MIPGTSPPAAIQQTLSSGTGYSTHSSFEGKRSTQSRLEYKFGQRLHSAEAEKAPYPLSYNRQVLELESLDNRLVKHLRGTSSFVNFPDGPPTRSLDLGCGSGSWVIDAAKEWPECEFVGFDLVNVQPPLKILDGSVAQRIKWVYGNFLTTKLPFDDDSFDHVHIQSIARGVPENKWGTLFDEINRVLQPGGAIEILEDDIIFPMLPRWFTAPLRHRARRTSSVHFPGDFERAPSPPPPTTVAPVHDHSLLESLFASVFSSRFINLKPTAVLPSYFTIYFRQVILGPVLQFPMPPLPPLQPLPQQSTPKSTLDSLSDASGLRSSSILHSTFPSTRPMSLSFSSAVSSSTTTSNASSNPSSLFSKPGRSKSASFSSTRESSVASQPFPRKSTEKPPPVPPKESKPPPPFQKYFIDASLTEDSSSVSTEPQALLHVDRLTALSERSLAMHLYRSYQSVLACQEAMWEELLDRLRNRKEELLPFGWDDDEEPDLHHHEDPDLHHRNRFERLIERYQSDMHARLGIWCSMCGLGYVLPPREPLSKAELIEEERIRGDMLEARKYQTLEDIQRPCRAIRALVGFKGIT